jgi:tetratricopeptide (TPR) repeat protein
MNGFGPTLKNALVVTLLFVAAPVLHAQTTDISLARLAEAVAAINRDQLQEAEGLLNAVLTASPNDADALNLLGVVRAKQDRPAEAERLFRRALASSPSHLGAHINLGELFLTTNRPDEAMQILLRAHKLAPDRPNINLNLATLYADKGNYRQAREHLRLVPRAAVTDDYFLVMLRSLIGLKRLEEVRELVAEFQKSNSGKPETQAEFAMLLVKAGFNDDALNILNTARQNATSFPIVYALGVVSAAMKQYDKAEENLKAALTLKPDDVATLRALARVARATGNLEKALSHLVQARRVAPDSAAVLYDFGVTALQMGLVLDALPVFERLHRDHPREPAYLYALAAAHWTKGETIETTRLLNNYVALQPRDPAGFYLLGAALLRQQRIPDAQAALQRSLNLKADADTEYLIGVSFEKAGNRAAAINTFRRVVQSRPDHAAAHAALGAAYREAGNYPEARVELERAVQLDSNDLRANYQLGLVYAKLGQKEAAKRMFDRADELRTRQRDQERVILKLTEAPQKE